MIHYGNTFEWKVGIGCHGCFVDMVTKSHISMKVSFRVIPFLFQDLTELIVAPSGVVIYLSVPR